MFFVLPGVIYLWLSASVSLQYYIMLLCPFFFFFFFHCSLSYIYILYIYACISIATGSLYTFCFEGGAQLLRNICRGQCWLLSQMILDPKAEVAYLSTSILRRSREQKKNVNCDIEVRKKMCCLELQTLWGGYKSQIH